MPIIYRRLPDKHGKNTQGESMGHWMLLLAAIVLEVAGTTAMKLSQGFSRFYPSVLIFVFYAASFTAFTFALKRIDVSVAYAVWSGIGTVLITAIGILYFREAVTPMKLISIMLIIVGVAGLNLGGIKD
jgi:small multidrug resistance pump